MKSPEDVEPPAPDQAASDSLSREPQLDNDIHISESAGLWTVHGHDGRRGGRFSDLKTAQRFVQREFGHSAKISFSGSWRMAK